MIETLRVLLQPAGWRVVDTDATGVQLPYFLILGSVGDRGSEDSVAGRSWQDEITVRAAGTSPGQVRAALDYSRRLLAGVHVDGGSRRLAFHRTGSRQVLVDRNVTLENDAHPCWVDDEYTVFSDELKEIHDDADSGV